jgi:C1A family cysteine protease
MTGQEFSRKYLNLDLNLNDIVAAQKEKGSLIDKQDKDAEVNFSDLTSLSNSTSTESDLITKSEPLPGRNLQTTTEIPESFDWRTKGVVSPVRNQAGCGSCWAFSTIAVLEARYALKYGKLQNLSEQQLINCVTTCNGCNGGTVGSALKFLTYYSNGVVAESSLPYATTQFNCNVNYMTPVVHVTDWATAGTQDEERIKKMLYNYGPLSVAINAKYLQYYRGGIIDVSSTNCNPYNLNHAVNLVGWGVEDGKDFWIVRNTWGPYWGENGYFRIARGKGTCGINKYVLTAFVK